MRDRLVAAFYSPSMALKAVTIGAIVVGYAGVTWLVYVTGGVRFSNLQFMYLPVILAGLVFETPGGIYAGLIAGLLLGPLMPLDTTTGESQALANWLYRVLFFCVVGGTIGAVMGVLRKQIRLLFWLNDHDARTGLLDNTGLLEALRRILADGGEGAKPIVLVVQMKNFLDFQNTFGIAFGEKLLVKISERARALVPQDVPIALIQPDRFGLVFSDGASTRKLREEIEPKVRESYDIDGVPAYVDFAFGAAEFPIHARSAEELLQKASIAMNSAVIHKRPFFLYDSASDKTSRDNLVLLAMFPDALANNELAIWYQAKVSLKTGQLSATEALLRWSQPQRGMIAPGQFIPQVEETTLINDLTRWVIQAALADMAAWSARGHSMGVSINLSVRNLHDRALMEILHETVLMHDVRPEQVELEITESAVMDDIEYCGKLVSQLRDRGYRVSIDDFGTGQSSLAYLKRLPVSALKIDRAFVKNLIDDRDDQRIVRSIINLARSFNLESIAEGVEDRAVLGMLREWGCDFAQGFGLHRPAPYPELLAWIESRPNPEEGGPTSRG